MAYRVAILRAVGPTGRVEVLRRRGGWIESSRGYRVRATGRAGLDYFDADGDLHIDSEMMATPTIVIYTDSIPDDRPLVLERVMRALGVVRPRCRHRSTRAACVATTRRPARVTP